MAEVPVGTAAANSTSSVHPEHCTLRLGTDRCSCKNLSAHLAKAWAMRGLGPMAAPMATLCTSSRRLLVKAEKRCRCRAPSRPRLAEAEESAGLTALAVLFQEGPPFSGFQCQFSGGG